MYLSVPFFRTLIALRGGAIARTEKKNVGWTFWTSRENVFESNLCSLYTSLPLGDTDVDVDDQGT